MECCAKSEKHRAAAGLEMPKALRVAGFEDGAPQPPRTRTKSLVNGGFTPRNNRTMFLGSGITLPKTSSNSYRLFALPASRVRVRWMCPGAILDTAPGITVLLGGGR